jgi:hypothetical protein
MVIQGIVNGMLEICRNDCNTTHMVVTTQGHDSYNPNGCLLQHKCIGFVQLNVINHCYGMIASNEICTKKH